MPELLKLFFVFMRIGAITFGGGYAMLPILQKELVERRGWVSDEELSNYFAIGQCTPGIIAVNVSTFIGYKRKGIRGGLVATLGFFVVPFVLVLIIAAFLQNFQDIPMVQNAFAGIRVYICVLVINAVIRLWKTAVLDKISLGIFIAILGLSIGENFLPISISPVTLVILAGLVGIIVNQRKQVNK